MVTKLLRIQIFIFLLILTSENISATNFYLGEEYPGKAENYLLEEENKDERPRIWLKFVSPTGYHRQILVTADPNASNKFEIGYDSPLVEDFPEDMYWYFLDNAFIIQGVKEFSKTQELALGIKVKEETPFYISIDELQNIPDDLEIYLHDSLKGITHNLRESAYKSTSKPGTVNNRFKLIFKKPVAQEGDNEDIRPVRIENIEIFSNQLRKEIVVFNPSAVKINKIVLTNLYGQQVHVYNNIPQLEKFILNADSFRSGIYILSIVSGKGVTTKKIIL